jgi:hypothetical protein
MLCLFTCFEPDSHQTALYCYCVLLNDDLLSHLPHIPQRTCHPLSRTAEYLSLPTCANSHLKLTTCQPIMTEQHPYLNCTCLRASCPINVYIRLRDYSIICR